MASKRRSLRKIHSLFPDSPTNRLLRMEDACGCLHYVSFPCLTPAQTYAIPPIIALEICPTSAFSTCMDYEGDIEYRIGHPDPVARLLAMYDRAPLEEPLVYMCWSVNWDGPIPPYPGLPPGKRDDLHFPSTFILDGSHGKWDCRVPQCWDNSRPWAPLIPSKNCPRYQNHPGLQSLVDVAIEAFTPEIQTKHDHLVNAPCILVLPSLLFTVSLFDSIRKAEINLFKAARGRPFVMWLRGYMYPVPDGENDENWLKEREFRHIEDVFGRLGVAQRYVCELIALAEWCHSCWNLMVGQYPTGPLSCSVPKRKDCVGGWVSGAPLPVIWHYQKIGVPIFFIEHCREEQLPQGLKKEQLPDLNGTILSQFPEYMNPPTVIRELFSNILGFIDPPLYPIRIRFQEARWAPYKPPEYWSNSLPTTMPIIWLPTLQQTTSQFEGLLEHIQSLTTYNHLRCSRSWYKLLEDIDTHRKVSITWKDERRFITHPRHAFQPSAALKPVPIPDSDDTITHLWVERVDGQGFAEVDAAHIHEFRARGFKGYHHKLCKQLVFFYSPGSLDATTEERVAKVLKPLEYTEEPNSMDIGLDLDGIPCDPPTMESQMPGVHNMERLEQGGRILVSTRMKECVDARDLEPGSGAGSGSQGDECGNPAELEEGEIGGIDHCPSSNSNHQHMSSSSGHIGPIRTRDSSAKVVQTSAGPRRRGRRKEWNLRDAPSDRRQRLWSRWIKLVNYFNSHQDLLNDLEPPPATVPGKHSKLKKPDWEGMQEVADILCSWVHRNRDTAQWMVLQHSDDKDRKHMWEAALRRLDYTEVWNTPQMDMPREDEPAARQAWLRAKEYWLPGTL